MNLKKIALLLSLAISSFFSLSCMEKAPLVIKNNLTDNYLTFLYISQSSDDIWGSNRLPDSNVLLSGSESETMVRPGTYDIQVTDSHGNTYTKKDIEIDQFGYTWVVTEEDVDTLSVSDPVNLEYAGPCPVAFTNTLNLNRINGIWIAPSDGDNWGDNHIPGYILNPGDTYTAYLLPGTYDLYVEDETGKCCYKWDTPINETGYSWNVIDKEMDFE